MALKFSSILYLILCLNLLSCGNKNDIKTTTAKPNETSNLINFTLDDSYYILKDINATEKTKKIEELLQKKYFNGCILVAQEGQILYKNAFGFANLGKKNN